MILAILHLVGTGMAVYLLWLACNDPNTSLLSNMHGIVLLIALVVLAWYRLIDRWPGLSEYKKQDFPSEERKYRAKSYYQAASKKHKIRVWWRQELNQIVDYFNIIQARHERKRDRIAATLLELKSSEMGLNVWDDRSRMVHDAYETAEQTLQRANELRNLEQMERIIWKYCPTCNGTGRYKTGSSKDAWRICPTCEGGRSKSMFRYGNPPPEPNRNIDIFGLRNDNEETRRQDEDRK